MTTPTREPSDGGSPAVTPPPSAAQLAEQLGDALPSPAEVPAASFALTEAVRDLVAAVAKTDTGPAQREAATATIRRLTAELEEARREPLIMIARHPDGRVENLLQAGSGRLNPQAPPLVFDEIPAAPVAVGDPVPVEIVGRCTLTAAHGGPPGRAHGGVIATILDEALGQAATASGATGLTVGINVRFRRATPLGEPLEIRARYTHRDGRKSFAGGEVRHHGVVTAEAEAVFIAPADDPGRQPGR